MPPVQEPLTEAQRNADHRYTIGRVAVLGAGTMGARIAAHVANAGLPVLLLDMVPTTGARNMLGQQALVALKAGKPGAFASAAAAALVSVGNFDDDLAKLKGCDWIIEAVAENLEIKRGLLARVAEHVSADAILTTNTSGLPVARIAEQLPEDLRRRWFGAHFFNPPRYMRLLEIISTQEADPAAVQAVAEFADSQLGKEVVPANDVQNFIANRVGTFSSAEHVQDYAGAGPHHRGDRRADRAGDRLAEERDFPPVGHGRHRRAGACCAQLPRERVRRAARCGAAGFVCRAGRAQVAGRQDAAGVLQERQGRGRQGDQAGARSGKLRLQAGGGGFARGHSADEEDRASAGAAAGAARA